MEAVATQLSGLDAQTNRLGSELDAEARAFIAPSVDLLIERNQRVSEAEGELARAESLLAQANALDSMRAELDRLRDEADRVEEAPTGYRGEARRRLGVLQDILRDILDQIRFPQLRNVRIDGATLMPIINGHSYLHTGTAFAGLATLAYHLALLQYSLVENCFFPRFLAIDSPAVGDLNDESHGYLLEFLASFQRSAEAVATEGGSPIPWQIVLTERRMIPGLEPYVQMRISNASGRMLLRRRPGTFRS
jgi:hypothetical protein